MIRKENPLDLYLLRHAEAYKNLAKVHGGGDQRLTPTGERQAQTLGQYLLKMTGGGENLHLVRQPEGRSEATANQIGLVASCASIECADLIGVNLGVAGGLSEDELKTQYPEVAAALVAWRTNKGDLGNRPRVPGSEPMEEFAERIHRGISTSIGACATGTSLAIVGTTSTLNMMNHLLVNDGNFVRSRYDFVQFPLGSLSEWQISEEAP